MKPAFLLLRILIVGLLWSIFFIEGIRVIMLTNWHFDILRSTHWLHAWNLWASGWVIDEPKEWAFILIVLSMTPAWITVWAALSSIKWEKLLTKTLESIIGFLLDIINKMLKNYRDKASVKVVKKKKANKDAKSGFGNYSIKKPLSSVDEEKLAALSGAPIRKKHKTTPKPQPITQNSEPKEFSHSLFNMDNDDDIIDFDLFEESAAKEDEEVVVSDPEKQETPTKNNKKTEKQSNSNPQQTNNSKKDTQNNKPQNKNFGTNSTFEVLKQKGYDIISGATIKNTFIDFIGISKNQICLCVNDKEPGDWLADEERFNDEEPLWFSESSHRISPVRKVAVAKTALEEKLKNADFSFNVTPFVVEQIGNIINAEDMLDIWRDLNINVTRIDNGSPKDIPLFTKVLEDAEEKVDKNVLEKLKKLLRNVN